MSRHYPDMSAKLLTPLRVVREMLLKDPNYLSAAECPYDADIKSLLRLLAPEKPSEDQSDHTFLGRTGTKTEVLELETAELYVDLKNLKDDLKEQDVKERVQVMKTRASLLEKLIDLIERSKTVRSIEEFQSAVLRVMEDELTGDQRERVMAELRAILDAPHDNEE